MKFSLRQIEIFAAVAKAENVSQAAVQLSMSQSAASSALVDLERTFERPLFDRIGKSLHLNATGRGLLPLAETLLGQAASVENYLSGHALGPLHVSATLTIGNYLATLLVAEFMQEHPEAPVQLHVANTDTVVERLLRFNSDLGLVEGEVSHPDLLVTPWLNDELVIFCSPGHRLASQPTVSNADLQQQAWILRERGSGTRGQFDQVIARQLQTVNIKLELEHTEAIKRAVESGLGISCLSRLSLREALRRGSLIELKTPQFALDRRFYFIQHRQRQTSPSASAFLALCQGIMEQATNTRDVPLPFIP